MSPRKAFQPPHLDTSGLPSAQETLRQHKPVMDALHNLYNNESTTFDRLKELAKDDKIIVCDDLENRLAEILDPRILAQMIESSPNGERILTDNAQRHLQYFHPRSKKIKTSLIPLHQT